MGLVQAAGQQLGDLWRRLSGGHRVILVLLALLCAGGVVAVGFWASHPQYEILYTGLSAKDCATLVASLKDAGIPARVADGGSAVMVPVGRMDAARMAAMIPQAQRALHVPSLKTSPAGQRFLTTSSTRRFLARPAAVRLVSMGRSSPKPTAVSRARGRPLPFR